MALEMTTNSSKFRVLMLLALVSRLEAEEVLGPRVYSKILRRECEHPGVIDVRVFSDQAPFEDTDFIGNQSGCMHARVLQNLQVNVSYGDYFRKSRINVVFIRHIRVSKVKFVGKSIKHFIKYDWTAKFLFLLPSVKSLDMSHISSLAEALTFNRLSNNVFVVNERHLFTFDILLNELQRHKQVRAAIDHLYSDKFRQMHRYRLDEVVDTETYPFHFVIYGRHSSFTREASFISMFVDRLNISMVDREYPSTMVDPRQLGSVLKENGIATAFGHTPGNFRRVFSHEMDGICAVTVAVNKTTFFDAFADPFDRTIWITWMVSSELLLAAWILVRRWQHSADIRTRNFVQEFVDLHFHLVQFFILSPPKLRSAGRPEKLLTFCYTIAIFNFVVLYVSSVTTNLSTARYRVGINTVQDLIDKRIPIVGSEAVLETLQLSRARLNLNGSGAFPAMAYSCSFLRAAEEESPFVHGIREPLLSHYIVYLLHQESILQEPLAKYVALSYQADLYRYWDNFIPAKVLWPTEQAGLTANIIGVEELIWQFVILPVGGLLGAVVLALELAWHKAQQFRLRKNRTEPNRNSNVITL